MWKSPVWIAGGRSSPAWHVVRHRRHRHAAFQAGLREDVPLKVQVPIHTTYITAWANRQGTVSFRDDVYNYDAQGTVSFL